ncbi:MAG: DUF4238 domain-containing protein [Promethearchaeota archaeon]
MKSHVHVPAVYLKHFSSDPSKGRNSLLTVYIKRKDIKKTLTVKRIGIEKNAYSKEVELFNAQIEKNYDKYINKILNSKSFNEIELKDLKQILIIMFNLILRQNENNEFIKKNYLEKNKNDGWTDIDLITLLNKTLITRRPYPFGFYRVLKEHFITSDNPVISWRINIGTIYFLPINKSNLFSLGYYVDKSYEEEMYNIINNLVPILIAKNIKHINNKIRNQAKNFYSVNL